MREYFHPTLFNEAQINTAITTVPFKFLSLAADFCQLAPKDAPIYIGHTQPRSISLVTEVGLSAMILDYTSHSDGSCTYQVSNPYNYLKQRGRNRLCVTSKNRSYVFEAVKPHINGICTRAKDQVGYQLSAMRSFIYEKFHSSTGYANNIESLKLTPENMLEMLKVMFEPEDHQVINLPTEVYIVLQNNYKKLIESFNRREDFQIRVKELFSGEKWLVGLINLTENDTMPTRVYAIGKINLNDPFKQGEISTVLPLRVYRSLEDFYNSCGSVELAESLKSALLFLKIHREKEEVNKSYDTDGLIPVGDNIHESLGAASWSSNYSINLVAPAWTIVSDVKHE